MPIGHADAVLPVHDEAALDDVDDLAVVGDGDGLGGVQGAGDVVLIDHPARNAHHAPAVDRGNVRAGQADQGRGDLQAGRTLGLLYRAGNRLGGSGQVDDGAFADSLGRFDAHPQDAQVALPLHPRDQGADLGRAYINSDDNRFVHNHHFSVR